MNIIVRVVASLIATMALLTANVSSAQSWSPEDVIQLHEYTIENRTLPGAPAGQSAKHGFVVIDEWRKYEFEGRMISGPELLDTLAARTPGTDREWKRTGETFSAWKPGTDGTVNVWRVYLPHSIGHVPVAEGEKILVNGVLVDALTFFRSRPQEYQVGTENGGISFAVKLPLISEVNGVKQAECPRGTRPMYRVYNGGAERLTATQVPMPYRFNDGNHRLFTNWRKLDETLTLAGWEIPAWNQANDLPVTDHDKNVQTGMLCLPAEVKTLWTTQEYAADEVLVNGVYEGSFYSQFDLAQGSRRDVFGVEGSRTLWTDTSLQEVLSPAVTRRTTIAKTGINQTAQVPLSRLTAIPHERSNTIVHVGGESNPQMIWGYNRTTGEVNTSWIPALPQGEQGVQALQVGDWLWVASCLSNCAGTAVRLYDQRSKVLIYEQVLPFQTAQGNGAFAFRPDMAFSPEESALYVASRHTGKLYRVHTPTRNVVEIPIPQGAGIAYGATDVKVDTANKQIIVIARGNEGAWRQGAIVKGKLLSYPYGSTAVQYTVDVGGSPAGLELGTQGGSVRAFVTNNYDDYPARANYPAGEATDTVSVVDVVRGVHVRKLPAAEQPTGLALVF